MNIRTARNMAANIKAGLFAYNPDSETIRVAFHKLDKSNPSTEEQRQKDMAHAKVIWDWVGKKG